MDEVEALARAYCREMGIDPDARGIKQLSPDYGYWMDEWERHADQAREQLAWR